MIGCGSVDRAVVSDIRDQLFESSYLQILFTILTVLKIHKSRTKGLEWPIKKVDAMVARGKH